jgi:hypothetical protein
MDQGARHNTILVISNVIFIFFYIHHCILYIFLHLEYICDPNFGDFECIFYIFLHPSLYFVHRHLDHKINLMNYFLQRCNFYFTKILCFNSTNSNGPNCGKTKAWKVGSRQEGDVRWWYGEGLCGEEA